MKICKLIPPPPDQPNGRWLMQFEDETVMQIGEREVVSFSLYTGMELDEDTHAALRRAVAEGEVLQRALRLLSVRPYGRKELIRKLSERCEPAHAERAADRLEELGYLDDAAYAVTVVRHYAGKGYGERKLRDELFRRGIDRVHWDDALQQAGGTEDAIDTFLRKKLAGRPCDRREWKRAADALARRGYRWDDINAGLRRYGADPADA
ncbi:MAG: recombination regulator RecX [Oscillospiraceae bacterium]|nr:recombination regulator RecX [Oscillospiraceae bacterium]